MYREARLNLQFTAHSSTGKSTLLVETPTAFLLVPAEGCDLKGIDGILSYQWLVQRRIIVDPYNHCLTFPPNWDESRLLRVNVDYPTTHGFTIKGVRHNDDDNIENPTPNQVEQNRRRLAWSSHVRVQVPLHPKPGEKVEHWYPILEIDEKGQPSHNNPACPMPTCIFAPHVMHMRRVVNGFLIPNLPRMAL